MVDPLAVPASLKAVILQFVLVACSFLDDARVKQLHQTHTGQPSGLYISMSTSSEASTAEEQATGSQQPLSVPREAMEVRQHSTATTQPAQATAAVSEWLPHPIDSPKQSRSSSKAPRYARRKGNGTQPRQHRTESADDHSSDSPMTPLTGWS